MSYEVAGKTQEVHMETARCTWLLLHRSIRLTETKMSKQVLGVPRKGLENKAESALTAVIESHSTTMA